ncbi:hypothetical protein FACS1894167_08420 [Synergistales bacterium]|nr:hypothetical protein FACS1894167_08420 [Synergistales bacterium]GHV57149.1 hypothetical protein FACS1894216_21550 [Synergistales bacterium]
MIIQSVARAGAIQDLAHQSMYTYGVERNYLPPKSPNEYKRIELPANGHMDTVYQYRQTEGWIGDVPVSFTSLIANRSYEYTKGIFADWDKRLDLTSTNSWIV